MTNFYRNSIWLFFLSRKKKTKKALHLLQILYGICYFSGVKEERGKIRDPENEVIFVILVTSLLNKEMTRQ